jgi:hypothetical protein
MRHPRSRQSAGFDPDLGMNRMLNPFESYPFFVPRGAGQAAV